MSNTTSFNSTNGSDINKFFVASEKELRTSIQEAIFEHHQLEAIFEQSPAAMVLWRGSNLVFEKVNPVYQAIFPDRELLGKSLLEALPEMANQPFYELIHKVLETGEPYVGHEILARHKRYKDGAIEDHYYDFNFIRVNDSEGRPYGVYNHAIDVTDRVRNRLNLEDSKRRLEVAVQELEREREMSGKLVKNKQHLALQIKAGRTLMESLIQGAPLGIIVVSAPDLIIETLNPVAQTITKLELEVGKSVLSYAGSKEMAENMRLEYQEVLETGKTINIKDRPIPNYADGSLTDRYYTLTRIRVDLPDGRKGVLVIGQETTEQVKLLQEQKKLLEESTLNILDLEEERQIRERFVLTLTHDLRTPLNSVKMSAQMIQKYPEKVASNEDLLARIVDGSDRIDRMIRDILDANSIRTGQKITTNIESCDLRRLMRDTLDGFSIVDKDRFVLNSSGPVEGYWCHDGLRRVIENLASNAIKYGFPKSPITITLDKIGEQAQFSVHNMGEELSPEEQMSLFKYQRRLQKADVSGKKGWGIGLTLVKGITEAHGGSIHVKSAPDQGTTFTVTLPLDARPFQTRSLNKTIS